METFKEFAKKQEKIQQAAQERLTPEQRISNVFGRELVTADTKKLLAKVEKSKAKEQELYARVQAHALARKRAEKLERRAHSTGYQTRVGGALGGVIGGLYGAYGGAASAAVRGKENPREWAKPALIGAGIGTGIGAAAGAGIAHAGHKIMKKDTPRTLAYSARYHAAKTADPKKLRNRVRYGIQRMFPEDRDELIAAIVEVLK